MRSTCLVAQPEVRFDGLSGTTRTATVWVNNTPAAPLAVNNGRIDVEVPARGIVAMIVPEAHPRLRADRELRAASWKKDYAEETVGGTRSMILDFGPGRRNVFTYLRKDDAKVKRAELQISIDGKTTKHTDDAYPFEWTTPLTEESKQVSVQVRLTRLDGKSESTPVLELHR